MPPLNRTMVPEHRTYPPPYMANGLGRPVVGRIEMNLAQVIAISFKLSAYGLCLRSLLSASEDVNPQPAIARLSLTTSTACSR
jgi:hypothetical protein